MTARSLPLFVAQVVILLALAAQPVAAAPRSAILVVEAQPRTWLTHHAAAELARYAHAMTGIQPRLAAKRTAKPAGTTVTLSLGRGTEALRKLPGAGDPERLRDGFVIEAVGPRDLRIAATQPVGLLYGVYDYLERHCGAGFFWDGDRIPRRAALPVRGIRTVELPRFALRHFGLADGWGLTKFHHHFRTDAERHRILDWMAKRKINISHIAFLPTIAMSGVPAKRVFGISDREPDRFTYSGWPGPLDFPAEVVTKRIKDQLDYGRKRGIRWNYYLAYGNVPHQFRQMHPEYRYVGSLGYDATVLYPDDPECTRWTRAFYQDIIRTYGTDHVYQDTPFCESTGSSDPEQSFQLKLKAAQMMCKLFKELDPQAIWHSDSWDMGAVPQVWTPERTKRYFQSLPQSMMRIYDTAADGPDFYSRTNYFEGTEWAFGILHSFQGDDHLHGHIAGICRKIGRAARDPKSTRLRGVYHVPETNGHNLLYFEGTTRATWNPDTFEIARFLRQYAERRYGTNRLSHMLPALEALNRAVYEGGGAMPIYKKLGCPYGPPEWWPIIGEKAVEPGPQPRPRELADLQRCLDAALGCDEYAWRDPFFVTDVVDWTRTYLAHVFNWRILDAYRAVRQKDAARAVQRAADARQCLALLEDLLSTRPDFSLQTQIDRVRKVPGLNPDTAWLIKKHCINDLYSANEGYEQMHWYYRPRMEVYLAELEARAKAGDTVVDWKTIAPRCAEIEKRWLEGEIAVPASHRRRITTEEAVLEAASWLVRQTAEPAR